jgi:PAS domain S-box-containing protein
VVNDAPPDPAALTAQKPLRVLLLEDVPTDAELIRHELRREDIPYETTRVSTRDSFERALEAFDPDIVLADYSLPSFDGLTALRIAKDERPLVPVVFVSGAIGEEQAIEALKQGGTDYVLKDHLSRLGPAVKRALREAKERRARQRAEEALKRAHDELEQKVQERTAELREANAALKEEIADRKRIESALRESEERLSALIDSALDGIISFDADRTIRLFNTSAETIFQCSAEKCVGASLDPFLSDDFRAVIQQHIEEAPEGAEARGRYVAALEGLEAHRANGDAFPVDATLGTVQIPSGTRFLLILRDMENIREAEEELTQLQEERVYLQEELKNEYNFEEIIGVSPAIQKVFDAIDQVATTDTTVLVTGETGTGKELVARAVHSRSQRSDAVLVKVNCAALPSDLIESELFGHEKGAFTGATQQRQGRFELADGGTLLLDEIGEMPLGTQSKLLRVLQEQSFERVGGTETLSVDVRVIAATNRDLQAEVDAGRFRSDLFYRLNIFPIEIPPLRDRREDIPLLADHFCQKFAERTGKDIEGVSGNARSILQRYDWPGNVRELANIIERGVILARGRLLRAEHIALSDRSATAKGFPTLEEAQRQHIMEALEHTEGVVGGGEGAAALLDINRTTLLSRMNRLDIDPATFR